MNNDDLYVIVMITKKNDYWTDNAVQKRTSFWVEFVRLESFERMVSLEQDESCKVVNRVNFMTAKIYFFIMHD